MLDGVAHRTPVMTSRTLDERAGGTVHLKCESFQRGGAFKFRGAFNFLSSLSREERTRGVCAISSGNHAQAVALSARELGIRAAILMPEDAPAAKLAAVEGYGAEITTYDRYSKPQVQAGREFAEERQMTFVPAYDDPRIAAGRGHGDARAAPGRRRARPAARPDRRRRADGRRRDGGQGAVPGRARGRRRGAGVGGHQALARGRRADPDPRPPPHRRRADAHPAGRVDVQVMRELVDEVVLVSDDEILAAMAFLFDRLKLVTEPSGAIATAALLAGHVDPAGARVGVLVSGGNVGLARFVDAHGGANFNGALREGFGG